MTAITIGDLRHRLVLEAETRSSDGGGGADENWTQVAEVWAAVRARSGSEALDADGAKGRVTHEVIIRWRADVTPAMRFREGARVFDIRAAVDHEDRRHWLTCRCEERVP